MKNIKAIFRNRSGLIKFGSADNNIPNLLTSFAARLMQSNARDIVQYPKMYETILLHVLFVLVEESVL